MHRKSRNKRNDLAHTKWILGTVVLVMLIVMIFLLRIKISKNLNDHSIDDVKIISDSIFQDLVNDSEFIQVVGDGFYDSFISPLENSSTDSIK